MEWTKESTRYLITLYETHDCLYNVKSKMYSNRNKRRAALENISESMKETLNFKTSPEEITKKINTLRTQMLTEIRKIKKSKTSGAGINDIYQPNLWCFEELSFLLPHFAAAKGESSLGRDLYSSQSPVPCEENESESEVLWEGNVNEVVAVELTQYAELGQNKETPERAVESTPRKRRISEKADQTEFFKKATDVLARMNDTVSAHVDFGNIVASEISSIKNATILRNLKCKIMNAIYEAQAADCE